jgi:hypothetical protein
MNIEYLSVKANQIKDIVTASLLVPTVLGGIYQIMMLIRMSAPYIRFFSLSQLIADGLFILVLLLFLFVPILGFYWLVIHEKAPNVNKYLPDEIELDNTEPTKETIAEIIGKANGGFRIFLLVCFILLVIMFSYLCISSVIDLYISLDIRSVVSNFFFSQLFLFISAGLFFALPPFFRFKEKFLKNLEYSLTTFFLLCFITFFAIGMTRMYQGNKIPKNLTNLDNLKSKILDTPDKLSYEIAYFNDAYIFAEVKIARAKDTIIKYKVLKFEELLNSDCK